MIPLPPIFIAALVTTAGVVALMLTEEFNPSGSPWAPLVLIALIAGHIGLFRAKRVGLPRLGVGARGMSFLAVAITVAGAAFFLWRGEQAVFRDPVSPWGNAQLGLITQVVARIQDGVPLYGEPIDRISYSEWNGVPIGGVLPFAVARVYGLDWRFASLGAVILLAAFLISAQLRLGVQRGLSDDEAELASWGALLAAAAGAGWLCVPMVSGMINWLHAVVLWPLIAMFALSVAGGWRGMAALAAGLLAAMNPGWLLMMPIVLAWLWAEDRRRFPVLVFLAVFWPLVAYGAYRAHLFRVFEGVFGNAFLEGASQAIDTVWRHPSLAGLGDLFALRPAVYLAGAIAVIVLTFKMARSSSTERRVEYLAIGGFVIVACGPFVALHQWMGHALLLGGFAAAPAFAVYRAKESERSTPSPVPMAGALAAIAGGVALVVFLVHQPHPGAIDELPGGRLPATTGLIDGFNIPSVTHAWGARRKMAVAFPVDDPQPGFLELDLGTLGGDFTPYNPTVISINGLPRGLYLELPGESSLARIRLKPGDLHIGYNVVELESSWARTPRSYRVGDDSRPVTIMYRGLRYIPLSMLATGFPLAQNGPARKALAGPSRQ